MYSIERCKPTSNKEVRYWVAYSAAVWETHGEDLEGSPGRVAFQIPSRSSVSDDTQLTLATCESIIENAGVYVERLASHFATWFATGRVSGIGASTLKSMRDLVAGVHWALAGSRGEYSHRSNHSLHWLLSINRKCGIPKIRTSQ